MGNKVIKAIMQGYKVQRYIGGGLFHANKLREPLHKKLELELEGYDNAALAQDIQKVASWYKEAFTRMNEMNAPTLRVTETIKCLDENLNKVIEKIEGKAVKGPTRIRMGRPIRTMTMNMMRIPSAYSPATHEITIASPEIFPLTQKMAQSRGYSWRHEANLIAYLAHMESGDDRLIASAYKYRISLEMFCLKTDVDSKMKFLELLNLPDDRSKMGSDLNGSSVAEQMQNTYTNTKIAILDKINVKPGEQLLAETFMALDKKYSA